jgi:hypothetical protein
MAHSIDSDPGGLQLTILRQGARTQAVKSGAQAVQMGPLVADGGRPGPTVVGA